MKKPNYKNYIRQKIGILNQEKNLINQLVRAHPLTIGTFYETIFKKFFKDFVPNKYKIGTGFVIDIENNTLSRQIDILVYMDDNFRPIYQHEDVVIVESSTVYAAIEVKADIDLRNIKIAKENMESVKEITYPFTNWYLIGIKSRNKKETILKHKREYLGDCDGLLVLDRYYIEGNVFLNDKVPTSNTTEIFLNNFLYRLMHSTARPQHRIVEYR
jgi:hypothetical protein